MGKEAIKSEQAYEAWIRALIRDGLGTMLTNRPARYPCVAVWYLVGPMKDTERYMVALEFVYHDDFPAPTMADI